MECSSHTSGDIVCKHLRPAPCRLTMSTQWATSRAKGKRSCDGQERTLPSRQSRCVRLRTRRANGPRSSCTRSRCQQARLSSRLAYRMPRPMHRRAKCRRRAAHLPAAVRWTRLKVCPRLVHAQAPHLMRRRARRMRARSSDRKMRRRWHPTCSPRAWRCSARRRMRTTLRDGAAMLQMARRARRQVGQHRPPPWSPRPASRQSPHR